MQIHELTQASTVNENDVFAIDTGSVTYKIPASVLIDALKTIGNLPTGVKGNMEDNYRTGNVNLTPANIGALSLSGGTMTGNIDMGQNAADAAGNVLRWVSSDGTEYYMRPYGAMFQVLRRPSGGSSSEIIRFNSDGSISVGTPANWRSALGAAAASDVSDLIIEQSFTLTTSISLNSLASASFDVPVTAPTGYKPIAALEGRVNGGLFAVTVNLINNTTARAYVINAGSGVRTGTGVTVDVLFIRDI